MLDKNKTDLTHLADLDCNGNWVRFLRGNDGDLHIVMATADEMTPERYKGIMHSVRVGVGNSGGQEVPHYVKKALCDLVGAFEKWEADFLHPSDPDGNICKHFIQIPELPKED